MITTFVHGWVPGEPGGKTVLLLHGTGGDENDLLSLGRMVAPKGASFLSPRGKVLERGMPRFFRRLSEGVFDLDDLRTRTHELADWIAEAAVRYEFDPKQLVAFGYSNGANIAASLLLSRPESLADAALLPFEPESLPHLSGKRILMENGTRDPIIPMASSTRLAQLFKEAGAAVKFDVTDASHGLEQRDVENASLWCHAL